MLAIARIKPTTLFTPEQWAWLRQRTPFMGLALVAHAWGMIALAMGLAVWQPWLIPLAVMIIGARQLGLAILMHEAAHGLLSGNQKVNDLVGQWLCAAPVGAQLKAYRPYHLTHHKFTQQAEDPDLVLSAPFPVTKASLRRKIIRDLTGQTFLKQRISQISAALGRLPKDVKGNTNISLSARVALGGFLLVNLILAVVLTLIGPWWSYPVLWLLPMATWFPLVTRIRNIAEHACVPESGDDPLRQARTTRANWLEGLLIAPYWVNYHAEHHLFMHLPCYRLPAAHRLLVENGHRDAMITAPGYLSVLREVTAPDTPRPEPAAA